MVSTWGRTTRIVRLSRLEATAERIRGRREGAPGARALKERIVMATETPTVGTALTKQSAGAILWWWESRRLRFNLICLVVGAPCLVLGCLLTTASGVLRFGEDYEEPLGILVAPILVNLAYCVGHVGDLTLSWLWPRRSPWGPRLWRVGIGFTLCAMLGPVILHAIHYLRVLVARH
jgi:hypothetical protein